MDLYDYQHEVIQQALQGRNSIIWLPTGGGKTRAAVYVTLRHLQSKHNGKAIVLVNKVHLVDQHYKKEFLPFLKGQYKVTAISGDSEDKEFFAHVVKENDVIICTAQILENALKSPEEEKHVELTDFTLLIIDECHHTQKDAVYNKIMERYIEKKFRREDELPQILGLTASPGTGGANSLEKAKQHVLQICANLDAWAIVSSERFRVNLESKVPQPKKQYDIVEEMYLDPFADRLKAMMKRIHGYLDIPKLTQKFGTQDYERDIVELEKQGAVEFNRMVRVCAVHLRKYNDALLINETVRKIDAFNCLDDFYKKEGITKTQLDETDRLLSALFNSNRGVLLQLTTGDKNLKLDKLEEILLDQFGTSTESRGIIFVKTRRSTHALVDWIKHSAKLRAVGIRADILTGAGNSNQTKHMTQVCTTQEPTAGPQCMDLGPARGRARAEDSTYSVLAGEGGREIQREHTNEYREGLMNRVIKEVQGMPHREYLLQIRELQKQAIVTRKVKEANAEERRQTHQPSQVRIYCRNCNMAVCHGNDIQRVEEQHHVNVNPDFKLYYKVSSSKVCIPKKFEDWEPGCVISCNNCGLEWGWEIIYKAVTLPILSIKNFVLETPTERRTYKKWKSVPFTIAEFDYVEYCQSIFPDLLFTL
nr:PREDICTED: probable ATP-dependent RNA helicase DHX58 [Latimeria chalumnae]|eukprot:XP_014345651.1 PREDICTED: probable ATP-dependent RNA helicase DHX58 [Latimeria chalumnae]